MALFYAAFGVAVFVGGDALNFIDSPDSYSKDKKFDAGLHERLHESFSRTSDPAVRKKEAAYAIEAIRKYKRDRADACSLHYESSRNPYNLLTDRKAKIRLCNMVDIPRTTEFLFKHEKIIL